MHQGIDLQTLLTFRSVVIGREHSGFKITTITCKFNMKAPISFRSTLRNPELHAFRATVGVT